MDETGAFARRQFFICALLLHGILEGGAGVRRRDLLCILGGFAGGVRLLGQSSSASKDGDFVIHAEVQRVLLDISVKDKEGGFVSGLLKENFRVFEDGKLQEIKAFSHSDIPVTVGIAVDESGSMQPKRSEVLTAALAFIQESNPEDEAFVLNFNERVYHGLPDEVLFSDNIRMLRTALYSGIPEGRTALYDAVVAGLKQLEMGRQDKKTLIVISDGGDNISKHSLKYVTTMVEASVATIYTIGVFDEDDPDRNPDVLKRLAHISGGVAFFPENLDQVVPICREIAKDIRNRYSIAYVPPAGKKGLRHIRVEAVSPDHHKLIVRTRTRYLYENDDSAKTAKR